MSSINSYIFSNIIYNPKNEKVIKSVRKFKNKIRKEIEEIKTSLIRLC